MKPLGYALTAALLAASPALAETDLEKALANGAERMTAEMVASRLADKTVTFENANTGARALVYYDGVNATRIKIEGKDILEGFYAFDLADHVCVGVWGDQPMRLRCVDVLLIDGLMHKFELDGSLRGRVIEEVDGNLT